MCLTDNVLSLRKRHRYRTHAGTQVAREQYSTGSCCADRGTCLRVRARSTRTGGMRARERYRYRTHAGTQGAREHCVMCNSPVWGRDALKELVCTIANAG